MTHIRFTIILPPVAQQRARSRVIKTGSKEIAMSYTAPRQRQENRKLEAMLYEHRPSEPLTGQVWLGVKAFLQIPTSKSKKWKAEAVAGTIRPTVKPDLDNLLKHLKDCLTGVFWVDDKQVVGYLPGTGKYYGDPARWEVKVVGR